MSAQISTEMTAIFNDLIALHDPQNIENVILYYMNANKK